MTTLPRKPKEDRKPPLRTSSIATTTCPTIRSQSSSLKAGARHLNISAFTDKITFFEGDVRIRNRHRDEKEIEITYSAARKKVIRTETLAGHGGADTAFMKNFMETYLHGKSFASTLPMSIESHAMAFAAEESRLRGGEMIELKRFLNERSEQ